MDFLISSTTLSSYFLKHDWKPSHSPKSFATGKGVKVTNNHTIISYSTKDGVYNSNPKCSPPFPGFEEIKMYAVLSQQAERLIPREPLKTNQKKILPICHQGWYVGGSNVHSITPCIFTAKRLFLSTLDLKGTSCLLLRKRRK